MPSPQTRAVSGPVGPDRHIRLRTRRPGRNDNPRRIADYLFEQHGVDGALETVRDGIAAAHADKDNYRLSVWREIKRALQDKRKAPAI